MTSVDHDLLLNFFSQTKSIQTQAIDFRAFIKYFNIKETTASILSALQKVIAEQNIRLSDEDGAILFPGKESSINLANFQEFLAQNKIEIPGFTPQEINFAFIQVAERQERIEKSLFIRILKGERDSVSNQEWLPYIVNEFIYHIINNQLNIFKFVNPTAKRLTVSDFQTLTQDKLRYKPSNPKDLPTLHQFFAVSNQPGEGSKYVSIDKILEQIRKLDPNYALLPQSVQKPIQS